MSEKDLIWVSKEIAVQYKALDGTEKQEQLVKDVIARKCLDMDGENELLSESLLRFKAVCLAHKNELQKVYSEENDKLYKLWEQMGDLRHKIKEHAKNLAAEIEPIIKQVGHAQSCVAALHKAFGSMEIYRIERLLDVANQVAKMDNATKELMRCLLNKPEQPEGQDI